MVTTERPGEPGAGGTGTARRRDPKQIAIWVAVAVVGAIAWSIVAFTRGEEISAAWLVFAAVASYAIAYRFYSRFIAHRALRVDDTRATPAERLDDGQDFQPTDRRVLFGHHFAAIAGAGPLVGPVLAAQMGYLPGTIWIIVGVVFAGAVQDMVTLFFSTRRSGRSLGQMAREEIGPVGGTAAIVAVLAIMVILLAVLALVVVQALADSPWGTFSLAMTIPIALFMGFYLRYLRPGKIIEVSVVGVALMLLAIVGGGWVQNSSWGEVFHLTANQLTLALVVYGFAASVLPVWMLLAPRDYLSSFMKVGVVVLLAASILLAWPSLQMDALTRFASDGQGPVAAGSLFPFVFITIACGALSGFHALVASGTTPKLIQKESQIRVIGYGAMLTESFVAIMALVLIRLEQQNAAQESAWLTELFVDDMDGQLRQEGIGDVVVGKHVGRMMSALGGRLSAYREGLGEQGDFSGAIRRNLYRGAEVADHAVADVESRLRAFAIALDQTPMEHLLAGELPE